MVDTVDLVDVSARYDKLLVGIPTAPLLRAARQVRMTRAAISDLRDCARNLQDKIDMEEEPETRIGEVVWLNDEADGRQVAHEARVRLLRDLLGEFGFAELLRVEAASE